ncbi:MAG: formylglycine-generating enzyme family protein [Bdellovibrionia bacterium]
MSRKSGNSQIFNRLGLGMLGFLVAQVSPNFSFAGIGDDAISGESISSQSSASSQLIASNHAIHGAGSSFQNETDLDNELLRKLYQANFSSYSKEIRANFTKAQLKTLRRVEALVDSTAINALSEQFTKDYFKEVRLNLQDDETRLINQMIVKGDRETADKLLTTAIIDQLDNEAIRLESEAQNPKSKLARFKAWEENDKTIRIAHQSTGDNNLHAAIDMVTSIVQSRIFFPDFIKKFAVYLQQIKNIHKDSSLSESERRDKLRYITNDIKEIVPRLNAYNKAKGYSQSKRVAKVKEELENLNKERLSGKVALDLDVLQVLREVLTDQLKVPSQPIKAHLAHMLKSKKDGIKKSDHELDYLRRRMEIGYFGEAPKDYRADFFQFMKNEKSFLNEDILGTFVEIPSGTFTMGSPESEADREAPETQHEVTLSSFEFMNNAVSQYTYANVMGKNPSQFKKKKYCKDSFKKILVKGKKIAICQGFPVEKVSWENANEFVKRVNKEFEDSDFFYRLPTEAEFEYAVRGDTKTAFVSGEDSSQLDRFMGFELKAPYSVEGTNKSSNDFRVYRSGVWEWTQDWLGLYPATAEVNPKGAESGKDKVVRGGSFLVESKDCRSALRAFHKPDYSGRDIGFRLVRVLKSSATSR